MELRIKTILKDRGESISDCASKAGITQANLSNIVNGKANPSLETLEKIAKALNIPVTELFEAQHDGSFTCPNCGSELKITAEKREQE